LFGRGITSFASGSTSRPTTSTGPGQTNIFGASFGTPGQAPLPAFQPADDEMSTSPDNSPHRPEQPASNVRQAGLLPLPSKSGIFGAPVNQTNTPEDEIDRPHIEEQLEKPNPFAALARPPPETPKPKPEVSKPVDKSQANPFGSIFNKPSENVSNPPKFSPYGFAGNGEPSASKSSEKPTAEPAEQSTSSTTLFKPSTPSLPAASAPSPAPFSGIFSQPAVQNSDSASHVSPSAPSTNAFSQTAVHKPASTMQTSPQESAASSIVKKTANADSRARNGVHTEDFTGLKSKWITNEILTSLLKEDNLPAPPSELELTEEEAKYYYQKLKVARLNLSYREYFTSHKATGNSFQATNLTPMMANYIHMYEELMSEPIEGRLTDLIHAHGAVVGQRIFDQEHGRIPIDGTSKRKAGGDISRESQDNDENVKKTRIEAAAAPSVPQFAPSPASSDTSNIFRSILDKEAPAQNQANGLSSATNGVMSTVPSTSLSSATTKQADGTSVINGTSTAKVPSFGAPAPSPATSGFKVPSFGGPAALPSSSNGIKPPTFGAPTGNFLSQFGQSAAKTAADEKKKRKDEDFDSDDSDADEAEWERKYEEEQAAKKKKLEDELKQAKTKTSKFVPGKGFVFEETAPSPKSDTLAPPTANGGFFGSRSVSPVPSTSGGSVFDAPRSSSPNVTNGNIFGYLSDVEGSGKGDADDEDSDGDDQGAETVTKERDGQFKIGQSSESDDPPSDTPSSRSLFDRITRDDKPESAPSATTEGTQSGLLNRKIGEEKPDRTPLSTTEGNQTSLFNFTKTSSGDHTWKPDSPIKFGSLSKTSSAPSGGFFGSSTINGLSASPGGTFGASSSGNNASSLFNFNPPTPSKSANELSGPSGGLFGSTASSNATTSLFNFNSITPSKPAGNEAGSTPAFKFAPPSTSTTPFGSPNAKGGGVSMFGNASSAKPASTFLFPPSATPSALGSSLTSAATSRATTPGLSDMSGAESTAGEHEAEAGSGDAAPILEQNDLVGMRKDQEGHNVLAEAPKAKAYKMDVDPKNPEAGQSWQVQGVGPIAVLTNQESGVVKILMKRIPAGGVVLNTRLIPDLKYEQIGKRARFSVLGAKGLESWLVQFANESEVKDFVAACEESKGSNAAKD
jgi:hypothetical protein